MLTVKIEDDKIRIFLDKLTPHLQDTLIKEVRKQSRELRDYIAVRHLAGGTSADRLAVRSGALRGGTSPLPVQQEGNRIFAGVGFTEKYARVHVGPAGQKTVIKPTNAKMLAIPLAAAKTAAGVARVKSPRDIPDLHLIKSKAGNLLLAKTIGKGKGKGKGKGRQIIPFYVLKNMVEVPARVHPASILAEKKAEIVQGFISAIERTTKTA